MGIPVNTAFYHVWVAKCRSCEAYTSHIYRRVTPNEPTKETQCCSLCQTPRADSDESIVVFMPAQSIDDEVTRKLKEKNNAFLGYQERIAKDLTKEE